MAQDWTGFVLTMGHLIPYRLDGTMPSKRDLALLELNVQGIDQHTHLRMYSMLSRCIQGLRDLPVQPCRMMREEHMLTFVRGIHSFVCDDNHPDFQRLLPELQRMLDNVSEFISHSHQAMRNAFNGLTNVLNAYASDTNDFDFAEFLSFLRNFLEQCALVQQPVVLEIIAIVANMPELPHRVCRLEHSTKMVDKLLDAMRLSADPIVLEFVPRFETFHRAQNECLETLRQEFKDVIEAFAVELAKFGRGIPVDLDLLSSLRRYDDLGTYASPNAHLLRHILSVFDALPADLSAYSRIQHILNLVKGIIDLSKTMPCQVPDALQPFELLQSTLQQKLEDMRVELLATMFVMRAAIQQIGENDK